MRINGLRNKNDNAQNARMSFAIFSLNPAPRLFHWSTVHLSASRNREKRRWVYLSRVKLRYKDAGKDLSFGDEIVVIFQEIMILEKKKGVP